MNKYQFSLPACAKNLVTIRLTTASIASTVGLNINQLEDLKISVSEMSNIALTTEIDRLDFEYKIEEGKSIAVILKNLDLSVIKEDFGYQMSKMILSALVDDVEIKEDFICVKVNV